MDYISKKKKSIWHSPLVLILLFFLLVITAKGLWSLAGKYAFSQEKHDLYLAELEELQAKKSNLEANIERLETDRGKEEEIRERFRVGKEGEEIIIVVDNENEPE